MWAKLRIFVFLLIAGSVPASPAWAREGFCADCFTSESGQPYCYWTNYGMLNAWQECWVGPCGAGYRCCFLHLDCSIQ